ncbi:MAG TPA: VCBS repeat-containing protein, partial [Gemmatimonadaceae bacterium]|nr:VCBS repeat-containing protein [Gemmatimonadaceae bacterium]
LLALVPAACTGARTPSNSVSEGATAVTAKRATPAFESVQPALFAAPGGQPNAWADFDNDGDLDLYVGFRGGVRARLYRNDGGTFTDVAAALGVDDSLEVRAAAWGDYDGDGWLDLFVGMTPAAPMPNKLYRNPGASERFVDVAARVGVADRGTTRQPSFVDFDNDGDLDLFVAFRDRPNALYRNDGGRFTDVAPALGIADPRKTVGVVWWDWEQDGDLDAFVANQDGDANGFYRNVGGRFADVADSLGLSERGRPADRGGVGPALGDFDNDGDLDLFVANYGPDALYRDDGGRFTNVSAAMGLDGDYHSTAAAWGDMDHDGRLDLFVVSYLSGQRDTPDHFFWNAGDRFVDVMPPVIAADNGSHGVAWADFDRDGDLDLALTNNHVAGTHPLYRNLMAPDAAARALQVTVRDRHGRATRAGSEVRVFAAGTRRLLGLRLVDTGGGYDSQGVTPVHVALPSMARVDVEVTTLTARGRVTTRVAAIDPAAYRGRALEVRAP